MKSLRKTIICAAFAVGLGSIGIWAEEPQWTASTSSGEPHVFVFVQRAPSHVTRSNSKVFHEVVDDLLSYLKNKSVATAIDEFGGKSYSEDQTPLATVQNITRDTGANFLLYVEVERPVTKWIKVTLHCYDMGGKTLWEEEASSGGGMSGGHGLRVTLDRIHEKLDMRLGQPGLPVKSAVPATLAQQ